MKQYPVNLKIEYSEKSNKSTALFRLVLIIPIILILALICSYAEALSIAVALMIIFKEKYPKVIFDFVEGFLRWSLRVNAYAILLTTDEYPPFRLGE